MKRIKVQSKVSNNSWAAEFKTDEEAQAWLAKEIANESFGKSERWVHEKDLSDDQRMSAIDRRDITGELESYSEYKLAAEFEVVEEDITAEVAQREAKEDEKKAKLAEVLTLEGKSSLTKAESDKVLLFLLKERLGK